jgi:hypothetical protein
MKAVLLILMVFLAGCLAGCDGSGPGRYQLVAGSAANDDRYTVMYLLDTKTGRVWKQYAVSVSGFYPEYILRDSSTVAPLNKERGHRDDQFQRENYSYEPEPWSWRDFFRWFER